jgi:hypothetical protein
MTEYTWTTCSEDLADDPALTAGVVDIHRAILREQMASDPMVNRSLQIQQRAFRHIGGWRVLLLLTPWMLSRLLFPDEPPPIAIPEGWSAESRKNKEYVLLGPRLGFDLLGQPQQAHLNFHARLGHYLLQPICLDMKPYADGEAVFEKWNMVIRTRDENMEKAKRDCPLQKEISRREFLRQFRERRGDNV